MLPAGGPTIRPPLATSKSHMLSLSSNSSPSSFTPLAILHSHSISTLTLTLAIRPSLSLCLSAPAVSSSLSSSSVFPSSFLSLSLHIALRSFASTAVSAVLSPSHPRVCSASSSSPELAPSAKLRLSSRAHQRAWKAKTPLARHVLRYLACATGG